MYNKYNLETENNFSAETIFSCAFKDDRIFVWYKESYRLVLCCEIAFLEASRDYSFIHFRDGKKWLVVHPMKTVLENLPSTQFQRISRSYTVNLDCVTRFLGNMVYIGERAFLISPAYREAVWSCFTFLGSVRGIRK